jgi:hypothetical protein
LATVIGAAFGFGAAGAALGVFLGKAAPGFYGRRSPFANN